MLCLCSFESAQTLGMLKIGKKELPNICILSPKTRYTFKLSKEEFKDIKKQVKSKNIVIKVKES